MRKISFIVTNDGSLCAFANGKPFPPVSKDHPNYQAIKEAVSADDTEALQRLTDIPKAVANFSQGKVEVKNGVVYYSGHPLHNTLTDRLLTLMNEKFPFEPMIKFIENLMENPSKRAVDELYDFLSHRSLPITEDGCFLGYKRVRDNFMDIYSGRYDNSVGKIVEMPRNQVDDNREMGCSEGLHVGTIEYVRGYSGEGCENGGNVVIVKVNPKDVVSVPSESNCTKLRTCKYEVTGMYEGDLSAPLYASTGVSIAPRNSVYNQDEDDYEDEEDEFEDEEDEFEVEEDEDEDEEDEDEDEDDEDEDDEDTDHSSF